jgi:hypothetical protein
MKKLTLLLTALFVLTAGTVFAQESTDVAVTAEVQDALTLTAGDIAFGAIQANIASYIQANGNDGTANANLGESASAGSLQIEGTTDANILVSWTNGTLTDNDGNNSTTFTPTVFNGNTEVTNSSTITLVGGNITLDVGGSLDLISNTGLYSTGNSNGSAVRFTIQYATL